VINWRHRLKNLAAHGVLHMMKHMKNGCWAHSSSFRALIFPNKWIVNRMTFLEMSRRLWLVL